MTNQYRLLIAHEILEKKLDIVRIRQDMESAGFHVINININPPLGSKYNTEVYYESDIPFPPSYATYMIGQQNVDTEVAFLQEVQNQDGTWVNVDKTLSQSCEAESCNKPSEAAAIVSKEDGQKILYKLCKYHAQLANSGISFNVPKKND